VTTPVLNKCCAISAVCRELSEIQTSTTRVGSVSAAASFAEAS